MYLFIQVKGTFDINKLKPRSSEEMVSIKKDLQVQQIKDSNGQKYPASLRTVDQLQKYVVDQDRLEVYLTIYQLQGEGPKN